MVPVRRRPATGDPPADAGAGVEEALDCDEVVVEFQPVDDRHLVVARRAEIRWEQPGRGLVTASTAVLRAACRPAVLSRSTTGWWSWSGPSCADRREHQLPVVVPLFPRPRLRPARVG